jgi:hypothetical protein
MSSANHTKGNNMTKLESVVIVKGTHGSVATIRFDNPLHDRFISSTSKPVLYTLIEKHIKDVLRG